METFGIQIPSKPEGKNYAVVLRAPGYSGINAAKMGAFGGQDVIPIPVFGEECVCCNSPTRGLFVPVEPSDPGGHFHAEPIDVPACPLCLGHAKAKSTSQYLIACLFCMGLPFSLLGFIYYDNLIFGGVGVALMGIAVLWGLKLRAARLKERKPGHYPGLSLLIAPRQLVVHTSNRQLAERLVEKNAPLVHRVR